MISSDRLLFAMEETLREVGLKLVSRQRLGEEPISRNGPVVVAAIDKEIHDLIAHALGKLHPKLPVVSEEDRDGQTRNRPSLYWLIDPLDGTASFVDGYPTYVTQIALMKEGRPILAAVFAPALQQMYLAEVGSGAFLNGNRLFRENQRATSEVLIDNYPEPRGIARDMMRVLGIKAYFECGSIGLKICRIADGSASVFVKDVPIRDWDIGAPSLILSEVGGFLSDLQGNIFPYLGSYEHAGLIAVVNEGLSKKILAWLREER